MGPLARREVLKGLSLLPLSLLARPAGWRTLPAGYTGGYHAGYATRRVRR